MSGDGEGVDGDAGQQPRGDQRGTLVHAQVALVEVERRAARRTIRILQEGIPASANGSIGRKIEKLRRKLARRGNGPAKPSRVG